MGTDAPAFVVTAIDAGVRPVRLRLPFRFGAVTLRACPQLFVRATIELPCHAPATGFAAEMMVPKWFDKRADFKHADNVAHLAASVERTVQAYVGDAGATAFELFERHCHALLQAGERAGATELSSAYGQAVIDRALIDALCRALGVSFFSAVAHNLLGLRDSAVIADLRGFDWAAWLPTLIPLHAIDARHTIGLLDELHAHQDADDGLPVSLPAVITRYGHRVFKIKLGGDPVADVRRLGEVLEVLDRHAPGHHFTLDGNEQYADPAALSELFVRLAGLSAYAHRPEALLYVEQPLPRDRSLDSALPAKQSPAPLLMDEADGTLNAFVRGRAVGWRGVSSKGCKGLYKAIVNRARCERWNAAAARDGQAPGFFMSAEDLTCQAGLAVQQDLALASLLGLTHSERNGHHYGDGFGSAPAAEQRGFGLAHPDLYESSTGRPRLRIAQGRVAIDSLFHAGFAHGADPDWSAVRPLSVATALV
ncbi:enolase C-terminal domain-like protein [Piscinibacter sp.]|uniref:enolase C-terminal domain-like protein n=1 Tax=Piscinibacter sp. TaxID=1903157 RepID=UPI002F3E4D30